MRIRFPVALILAASAVLGIGVSASAQTAFRAEIEGKQQKSEGTATGCADGAQACGSATIDGYGLAEYRLFLASFQPTSDSCGDYTATATFTLQDDSTLTLDETGTVCGPGKSFYATPPFSWGNPSDASGSWQVQSGAGQFAGMTGNGTDDLHSAGSRFRGNYAGTLDN